MANRNPYRSPNEGGRIAARPRETLNLPRGLLGAFFSALIFPIPVAVIAVVTYAHWELNDTRQFDRQYDINWWRLRAFPGVVVVPLLLFFSGLANFALPRSRRMGMPLTLGLILLTSLPISGILGSLGMAHQRIRSIEHPPMYLSEIFMILIPVATISCLVVWFRMQMQPKLSKQQSTEESENAT